MSKEMEKKTLHIVEKTYAVIYKENSEKPIEIEVDGIDPELIYKAYPSIVKLSFYNQNVAFDGRYTYKCQPFNLSRNIHFGERYSADEAKELSCSGIVNYMSVSIFIVKQNLVVFMLDIKFSLIRFYQISLHVVNLNFSCNTTVKIRFL